MCSPPLFAVGSLGLQAVGALTSSRGGSVQASGIDQQARGQEQVARGQEQVARGQEQVALAQIEEGRALRRTSEFRAQIAENNAVISRRNSEDAITRGKINAGERELKTSQDIGRQRVALAASGQEVDSGTPGRLTGDTAALGKLDSLRIVNNSEREAAAFGLAADTFTSEAALQRATGSNAIISSRIRAKGTRFEADGTRFQAMGTRFEARGTRARAKAKRSSNTGSLISNAGSIGLKFVELKNSGVFS